MASVNCDFSKLEKKFKDKLGSSEVKSKIKNSITGGSGTHSGINFSNNLADEIATKFIDILKLSMESSGLSANAIQSISNLEYTSTYNEQTGILKIKVSFKDTYRPSLYTKKYDGVDDIVMLLNEGVDHVMNPVYGVWHGEKIRSATTINGAHFLEQARDKFLGEYGAKYNVLSVEIENTTE